MNKKFVYGLDQLEEISKDINNYLKKLPVLTLQGSLGAGKTTLVKALLSEVGVDPDEVTSPTFTYVNVYKIPGGKKVFHFDLYRIESEKHFIEMGFDEYLNDEDAIILIEWPEVIEAILPEHLSAKLEYEGPDKRKLTLDTK